MLTEAETKEIRNDAKNWVEGWGVGDEELSFIAGATRMAEKKNVEAESRERLLEEYSSALLALRKKNDVDFIELERVKAEKEQFKKQISELLEMKP